jgi:hypothetical protein
MIHVVDSLERLMDDSGLPKVGSLYTRLADLIRDHKAKCREFDKVSSDLVACQNAASLNSRAQERYIGHLQNELSVAKEAAAKPPAPPTAEDERAARIIEIFEEIEAIVHKRGDVS